MGTCDLESLVVEVYEKENKAWGEEGSFPVVLREGQPHIQPPPKHTSFLQA